MIVSRILLTAALTLVAAAAYAGDDVLEAIDHARKAYEDGNLSTAKQQLDLASQLVGQKNAESLAALLPEPLSGWKGDKAEKTAVGTAVFGATSASRLYHGPDGHTIQVRITGDSAMVMQFAQLFLNPIIAGTMGKLITIGNQRAVQSSEGTINIVVNNKYLVTVEGSADAAAKLAYAQAVNIAKLSKM